MAVTGIIQMFVCVYVGVGVDPKVHAEVTSQQHLVGQSM